MSPHQNANKFKRANSSLPNYSSINTTCQTNEKIFVERQLKRRNSQQKVTLYLRQLGKQSVSGALTKMINHSASVGSLNHSRIRTTSQSSLGHHYQSRTGGDY